MDKPVCMPLFLATIDLPPSDSRASENLMQKARLYADHLSVNGEMPTEQSLKLPAPDKNHIDMIKPTDYLK